MEARLGQRIEFGTAGGFIYTVVFPYLTLPGLRAKMQAGYSSMNDLIIIRGYYLLTSNEALISF